MAAPDDAENNNTNAMNFQELKDIELSNKLSNIHPIFSSIDEVRKQIYFMIPIMDGIQKILLIMCTKK